jgi:methyl-accepting chemotaxis protein
MLRNLKITQRLAIGFGALLLLICATFVVAIVQANRLAEAAEYYSENLVPSYQSEYRVDTMLRELRGSEFQHVLASTPAQMATIESRIGQIRGEIAGELDKYEKGLISDDQDKRLLVATREAIKRFDAEWDKVLPVSRQTADDPSKTADANNMMLGSAADAYNAAVTAIKAWWDYNVSLSEAQTKSANATRNTAFLSLGVMVVGSLLLGVGAAIVISRSVVKPVQRAVEVASTVARGDLTSNILVEGRDETAQLMEALATMNTNLFDIVGQVRSSSNSIATGSAEIATGNADLSQRTEEQASNLQETAASMEELSSTVKANADTANRATELASSASEAAEKGGALVDGVVQTMHGIAEASKRISDITGVIDGIAFQTNILALNAAVEAARAGEQGRGFAVVAGEVRTLAQRSAEAAKEIKVLLGANVEKVRVGSAQVDAAGASMRDIVEQVQAVNELIRSIAHASSEQTTGIGQVGDAISQLDQVTQQNAALVEESAAAAESLRIQAAKLTEVVGVFKLA